MTPPEYAYCTYFDHRYLSRGLSLIASLRQHGDDGIVWVLCLSEAAYARLTELALPGVRPVRLVELETAYPAVAAVKSQRTTAEYYFTWTAWWMQYVMDRSPAAEWTTYLDADLWFFASPTPIYEELAGSSVGIVPHRFAAGQEWRLKYGTYNVGWVSFRPDDNGRACLRWWAERCLEWCHDSPEAGRFADQGYLDAFADVSSGVHAITHPGANLAPWNLASHDVAAQGDTATVDGLPLVFFHFHGIDRVGGRFYFKHAPYRVRTTSVVRDRLYRPYLVELIRQEGVAGDVSGDAALQRRTSRLGRLRVGRKQAVRLLARVRGDSLRIA